MRLRAGHIVLLLTVLAALSGCGHKGRVIPERKLIRLYSDLFVADQWLRDHPDAREAVDTSLFYDPIFRRHGYSFADYDRSVHFYLDRPEKYNKLLNRAADQIRKEGSVLEKEAERERAHRQEIEHLLGIHRRVDFEQDSLRWAGPQALWPVYVEKRPQGWMLIR